MIDLKKLEENLTDEQIIQLVCDLGSDTYVDKGDHIIFKTICHNENADEASLKLYYYKKNHKFHCYTDCGENFNIYSLFKKRYELLGIEYNFYTDIVLKILGDNKGFGLEEKSFYQKYKSEYENYQISKQEINISVINPTILEIFIQSPPIEWINDGINEETMKLYNIRYSILQNKIIIPHYDVDNNLIGIRGRALNEEDLIYGKYMPIQIENKIYSHPLMFNLYGLNIVKNNIKRLKTAIIGESEKATMQYNSMVGKENNICVAVCGSSIHKYQIDLLRKEGAEKIIIAFDKEWTTAAERTKYFNHLVSICSKFKNYVKIGFIFDRSNLLENKDSPFDKGYDTFKKLYKGVYWL